MQGFSHPPIQPTTIKLTAQQGDEISIQIEGLQKATTKAVRRRKWKFFAQKKCVNEDELIIQQLNKSQFQFLQRVNPNQTQNHH